MIAVIKTGKIVDGKVFETIEQVRNYIKMRNTKRKWRANHTCSKRELDRVEAIDVIEDSFSGARFFFIEVSVYGK